MNPNRPRNRSNILWIIVIIAIIALVWYGISSITDRINQVTNPLRQANDTLNTQVSQLLNPTPTIIPDPVTIIHEIKTLAQLVTIQYSVEKVITAEVNQGILELFIGDRLLFVAHGYVTAGIDLQKLSEEDLWLEDGVLHARLPAAEIFVATLDNQKSYVYDRDTGLLTHGNQDLETAARQAAEAEIRKAAEEDGILNLAEQNAQVYLERFFRALGYETVIFEETTP